MEQNEVFAAYGTLIEKHLNCENIDEVFYIDTGADTLGEFQATKEFPAFSTC